MTPIPLGATTRRASASASCILASKNPRPLSRPSSITHSLSLGAAGAVRSTAAILGSVRLSQT